MSLRSGYKGFKKLAEGLKMIRPGILGIETYSESPITVNEKGLSLNVGDGLTFLVDPQLGKTELVLDTIFEKLSGTGTGLAVSAGGFTNVDTTIPEGYTILTAKIIVSGDGASAHSFASLVTGNVTGRFVVCNNDTVNRTWNYTYEYILIKNEFVKNYTSRTLSTTPEAIPEAEEETKTTKKTTTKKTVKEGE